MSNTSDVERFLKITFFHFLIWNMYTTNSNKTKANYRINGKSCSGIYIFIDSFYINFNDLH